MARTAPADREHVDLPPAAGAALACLAGPVRRWFAEAFGNPTPAQRLAWPALAAGKALLLSAPTGSGKTLAAFLPLLSRLLDGPLVSGIRLLYVAPLKALGNDARRNLRAHLRGIRRHFPEGRGRLRVALRTGDTLPAARRRLLTAPSDVLLTTPESLAVLLSQPAVTPLFADLQAVIIDEVHALAAGKRGADLALSLERLTALAGGELQRVGLSATCAPLDEAAGFLVGVDRPCIIARVPESAPLELTVEPLETRPSGPPLAELIDRLGPELAAHGATLIFTNTRRLAERLAWALRRRFPEWDEQIAVHHSAVAAARRRDVERRFKAGQLRAVVSSTSLELGIDIGSVDRVVLVHPPGGVVRLLQRVGRAGHGPGRRRRGLVLTASAAELLEAAVTVAAGLSGQHEPLRVPTHPLDVLCQQLLGMACERSWQPDEAFALVRRAYPYRNLPRPDFDACLDYLSGRGPDGAAWLPARLRWQEDSFTVRSDRTARLLRQNVGTILADERRPVLLVNQERGTMNDERKTAFRSSFIVPRSSFQSVGDVDNPFADRLRPGDPFLLAGRCLEFRRFEGPAVIVQEVPGRPVPPRWAGDGWPLSPELAERLYLLRARAAEALRDGRAALDDLLRREYGLGATAAAALVEHFERQEQVSEVPAAAMLLVERVSGPGGEEHYAHTPLNRAGNDAVARVAVLRLARDCGLAASSVVADLGFGLFLRAGAEVTADAWRALLAGAGWEEDLTVALADTPVLRERFRRAALTGLMLLKNPLGRRRRVGGDDWAERRLFDKIATADPEFVLLRQARREICDELCDAAAARAFVAELPRREVRVRRLPHVGPFVEGWTQLGAGPVGLVEGPTDALRKLHAALTGRGGSNDRA